MDPVQYVLSLLNKIANLGFNLGLIAAIFLFIYFGLRYILSGIWGGENVINETKNGIILIIVGLFVLFIAFSVPKLLCRFLLPGCTL